MKVLSINEKDITMQELIQQIRTSGRETVLKPILQKVIIENYAQEKNIFVTTEELQERFDHFRKSRGLFSASETERWLSENQLTLDDLERNFKLAILSEKIQESFAHDLVEKFFAENKVNMDAVELSVLTVKEEEVAKELLALIKEDEADFMVLAREYSIDQRAKMGGYLGIMQRPNLRGDVAAAVFGAEPGDVVGPFATEAGYNLLRVNAIHPALLEEKKEKEIRNVLLQKMLIDEEQKLKIAWAVS